MCLDEPLSSVSIKRPCVTDFSGEWLKQPLYLHIHTQGTVLMEDSDSSSVCVCGETYLELNTYDKYKFMNKNLSLCVDLKFLFISILCGPKLTVFVYDVGIGAIVSWIFSNVLAL